MKIRGGPFAFSGRPRRGDGKGCGEAMTWAGEDGGGVEIVDIYTGKLVGVFALELERELVLAVALNMPRAWGMTNGAGERAVVGALALDGVVDAVWRLGLDLERRCWMSGCLSVTEIYLLYRRRCGRSPC